MRISRAARLTGLTTKTIRYYEEIGLITPARRGPNGYRSYSEQALNELRFVKNAREAGFNLEECRELVNLYLDHNRASAEVKALALAKIEELGQRIEQMRRLRSGLMTLAEKCDGDQRPQCPILEALEQPA